MSRKKGLKYCKLPSFDSLSYEAQSQIMVLIEEGVKIKKIARNLNIKERTIPTLEVWHENESQRKLTEDNVQVLSLGW